MEHMGYGEHIANTVKNMPYQSVIQTDVIADMLAEQFTLSHNKAKNLVNVKLKRMADKGEIARVHKGIYCQIKDTVFGKVTPNIDEIMLKILTVQNDVKIGYESGEYLFNKIGLTTLIPRDIEITTNRFGMKLPETCHIKLKKPCTTVTDENWKYLQFIDLINQLSNMHIDVEHPEKMITQYAKKQQLDYLELIFTVRRYYGRNALLPIIDLLMEMEA